MTLEALIAAITALVSYLPPERAREHVDAALTVAAETKLPVELLLGVAYVESRYDQRALSRIECEPDDPESCVRKTGAWHKATKPPRAKPSWFCGPLQSGGNVAWAECQRMRSDVLYGYRAGARELHAWLDDKRCARLDAVARLRCALAGYNGGNASVATYKTSRYANWVFALRDRIVFNATRAATRAPRPAS